jgi:hypothetical protein
MKTARLPEPGARFAVAFAAALLVAGCGGNYTAIPRYDPSAAARSAAAQAQAVQDEVAETVGIAVELPGDADAEAPAPAEAPAAEVLQSEHPATASEAGSGADAAAVYEGSGTYEPALEQRSYSPGDQRGGNVFWNPETGSYESRPINAPTPGYGDGSSYTPGAAVPPGPNNMRPYYDR